jgi:hypothetical protein
MDTKVCRLCRRTLPVEKFYKARGTRDGRRGECRDCFQQQRVDRMAARPELIQAARDRTKRWQQDNPDRYAEQQRRKIESGAYARALRKHFLKKKYGLTVEEYDRMLADQGGVCYLCGRPPRQNSSLHVDHCHDTGKVRRLLCFSCNAGIGHLQHDPELLTRAAQYVAAHRRIAALRPSWR